MASENRRKTDEKYPNRFKKGQSGNPGGRPPRTEEQKDTLQAIRDLAPQTPAILSEIMNNPDAPIAQRLKVVEIVLDRTFGKPDMAVRLEDPKTDVLAEIRSEVKQIRAASGID